MSSSLSLMLSIMESSFLATTSETFRSSASCTSYSLEKLYVSSKPPSSL